MGLTNSLQVLHSSCNPSCIVSRCARGDCVIRLPSNSTCIDCDICNCFPQHLPQPPKRPDFIVCHMNNNPNKSRWFVIDFKGNISHISRIVYQLQMGAKTIQNDTHFQVVGFPEKLTALIVHEGRGVRTADLARRYILFLGKRRDVRQCRCETNLSRFIM